MIHKRQMRNDKFTEKGRGDELNYFLKLAREQLAKIRANRISEISEDIEQLNEEIKKLEKNTSYKSKRLKEKLVQDIQNLKGLLEQFKKSLENDKKGMWKLSFCGPGYWNSNNISRLFASYIQAVFGKAKLIHIIFWNYKIVSLDSL